MFAFGDHKYQVSNSVCKTEPCSSLFMPMVCVWYAHDVCMVCRKEPFANGFWSTRAENWNGRAAMMGFTFLIITEALSGKSIPHFYGLL